MFLADDTLRERLPCRWSHFVYNNTQIWLAIRYLKLTYAVAHMLLTLNITSRRIKYLVNTSIAVFTYNCTAFQFNPLYKQATTSCTVFIYPMMRDWTESLATFYNFFTHKYTNDLIKFKIQDRSSLSRLILASVYLLQRPIYWKISSVTQNLISIVASIKLSGWLRMAGPIRLSGKNQTKILEDSEFIEI